MPKVILDGVEYQTKCLETTQLPYSNSQALQDVFVVTLLECKQGGTYLELGAGPPIASNNTYLLEKQFGFVGTSIDIDTALVSLWQTERPTSNLHIIDAFDFDYSQLPAHIDYLQVDIDSGSLEALEKLKEHRFSVITFEHDCFSGDLWPMWQSREILTAQGYELLVNNVTIEPGRGHGRGLLQFEDWYVDPTRVSTKLIDTYRWLDETAFGFQQRPARQEPLKMAKYPKDILFKS